MAFSELPIEKLTREEVRRLHALELGEHLADIATENLALGKLAIEARYLLADAKKALKREKNADTECALIDAQTTIDTIKERVKTLRDVKSILQTSIRAIPG